VAGDPAEDPDRIHEMSYRGDTDRAPEPPGTSPAPQSLATKGNDDDGCINRAGAGALGMCSLWPKPLWPAT
jgi:hypothetical protein